MKVLTRRWNRCFGALEATLRSATDDRRGTGSDRALRCERLGTPQSQMLLMKVVTRRLFRLRTQLGCSKHLPCLFDARYAWHPRRCPSQLIHQNHSIVVTPQSLRWHSFVRFIMLINFPLLKYLFRWYTV